MRSRSYPVGHLTPLATAESIAPDHAPPGAGVHRHKHEFFQVIQHVIQTVRLPAPPRRRRRQGQLFVQQSAAQGGQKRYQRSAFQPAAAQRVDDADVAGPHRLHQTCAAEQRRLIQFERIAERIVQPPQDDVNRLQAGQRFEIDALVAHRQVAALDQGVAEVARQIGVLEVGFVIRSGGQQHDARVVAVARCHVVQRLPQGGKVRRQPLHLAVAQHLGQDARQHLAILQRIAGPGRALGAVGQHPPTTVRRARQVGGVDVQVAVVGHRQAVARPQKAGVREHQFRRQQPFGEQALRAVYVRQHGVQQPRPLRQGGFQSRPFRRPDNPRHRVQFPRAFHAARVVVHVVRDAVFVDHPPRLLPAVRQFLRAQGLQRLDHVLPVRARLAVGGKRLVVGPGWRAVAGKQAAARRAWCRLRHGVMGHASAPAAP